MTESCDGIVAFPGRKQGKRESIKKWTNSALGNWHKCYLFSLGVFCARCCKEIGAAGRKTQPNINWPLKVRKMTKNTEEMQKIKHKKSGTQDGNEACFRRKRPGSQKINRGRSKINKNRPYNCAKRQPGTAGESPLPVGKGKPGQTHFNNVSKGGQTRGAVLCKKR